MGINLFISRPVPSRGKGTFLSKVAGVEIVAVLACLAVIGLGLRVRAETLGLEHFEALPDEELPGLSVIIAARDEERVVEAALRSILELDYPDLEVVFVDDRSSDRTGEIARALAHSHSRGERLKVLTCEGLPPGWLGKIHALHLGTSRGAAREAAGPPPPWLLPVGPWIWNLPIGSWLSAPRCDIFCLNEKQINLLKGK